MKTYVITLSKTFDMNHPKCGMPTNFRELYEKGIKIQTIRANYPLWKKRFENIMNGDACLSLRQWSGKPYACNQELICNLYSTDGIGLQQLIFSDGDITMPRVVQDDGLINPEPTFIPIELYNLAAADGLSIENWLAWFKGNDLSKSMAIIHFTKFRWL